MAVAISITPSPLAFKISNLLSSEMNNIKIGIKESVVVINMAMLLFSLTIT